MKHTLRITAVAAASLAALVLGWRIGPVSALPNPVLVNEAYVEVIRNQFLFMGALTSGVAVIIGLLLGLPLYVIATVVMITGLIIHALGQVGDPDFLDYYLSSVLGFLAPYALTSALVFLLSASLLALIRRQARQ